MTINGIVTCLMSFDNVFPPALAGLLTAATWAVIAGGVGLEIRFRRQRYLDSKAGKRRNTLRAGLHAVCKEQNLPTFTRQAFKEKVVMGGAKWVIVTSVAVDVADWIASHPGGASVLRAAIGTDITGELLGDVPGSCGRLHQHSRALVDLLHQRARGVVTAASSARKAGSGT